MAGAFENWVAACCKGNKVGAVHLLENVSHKIAFQTVSKLTIGSKSDSGPVERPDNCSSIEVGVANKFATGATPMKSANALYEDNPLTFIQSSGNTFLSDWSFASTSIVTCWTCHGNRSVTCMSCSGNGKSTCSGCGGRGSSRCNWCAGSGYRSVNDMGARQNPNMPGLSERRVCQSCNGGQVQCSSCYGSGKRSCGSCGGSGKVSCGTCSGDGKVSRQKTERFYCHAENSKGLDKLADDGVSAFIADNWSSLVRKGYFSVVSKECLENGAELSRWVTKGRVSVNFQSYKVSDRKFDVLISGADASDLSETVFDCPHFLGEALNLDDLNPSLDAGKKLIERSDLRVVGETAEAFESANKDKERRPNAIKALTSIYGAALSAGHREKLAELVSNGLPSLRSAAVEKQWAKFILLSLFVGVLAMFGLHLLANFRDENGLDAVREVFPLFLIFSAFWMIYGFFYAKSGVTRLSKKLGLSTPLQSRQGGWLFLGPFVSLTLYGLGAFLGIYISYLSMLYLDFWKIEHREIAWDEFQTFQNALPTTQWFEAKSNLKLRMSPTTNGKVYKTIPSSDRVEALGPPLGDWVPLRASDEVFIVFAHKDYLNPVEAPKAKAKPN